MLQVKQYLAHTKTNLSLYIDKQTPCGVTNPAESEKIMKKRTNEIISAWAVKSFNAVKGLTIIEA